MPIYVARWEELSIPDTDPGPKGPDQKVWVPLGVTEDDQYAALDLTPPGAVPWRCLFRSPVVLADVPGRRRLSAQPGERLTTLIRNRLGNDLGVTLEDRPSLAEVLAHILLDHAREDGTRWRPLRRMVDGAMRINLGGRVWEMLPIRGGASIADDFNRANNADLSVGAPFAWTEVQASSPIGIVANEVKCTDSGSTTGSVRAEVDLASDDHYAQARIDPGSAGQEVGPAVRFDPAANTLYLGAIRNSTVGTFRIFKWVAGVETSLGNIAGAAQSGFHLVRHEVDGSSLRLIVDGVEQMLVTDTALVGNLRAGIAAGGNASWFADDFEAGDLGAPPATHELPRVSETDTARALVVSKSVEVPRSTTTDLARELTASKTVVLPRATETDVSEELSVVKSLTLARAVETDTARELVASTEATYVLPRATETDTARALSVAKSVALPRAPETDAARELTAAKAVTLARATELGTARELDVLVSAVYVLPRALETDAARALSSAKLVALQRAAMVEMTHASFNIAGRSESPSTAGRLENRNLVWILGELARDVGLDGQPSSSLEYVRVPVRAELAGAALDPTDGTVHMAFVSGAEPVAGDWKDATWETAGTEYLACCLVGPEGTVELDEGIYEVWVKFTDNPEIPARYAGVLRIT